MSAQEAGLTDDAQPPSALGVAELSDDELWAAFRSHSSQEAREALFLRYLPFARRTAMRTLRLHGITKIEFADVYQSACIGLIQAMDRFDSSYGAEFTTYATYRVQGAVLNAIETYSEVQQQIAARGRNRSERLESLRPDEVLPATSRASIVEVLAAVSMGLAIGFMLEDSSVYADPDVATLAPDSGYETLAWKQAQASLQQQVDALPEGERKVLAYHYFQGLDFVQVATLMGLSKSRISQIHKQGLAQLRRQLSHTETFFSAA
jgi:RNA polymerase sigma factor for flagellar operon FliA